MICQVRGKLQFHLIHLRQSWNLSNLYSNKKNDYLKRRKKKAHNYSFLCSNSQSSRAKVCWCGSSSVSCFKGEERKKKKIMITVVEYCVKIKKHFNITFFISLSNLSFSLFDQNKIDSYTWNFCALPKVKMPTISRCYPKYVTSAFYHFSLGKQNFCPSFCTARAEQKFTSNQKQVY